MSSRMFGWRNSSRLADALQAIAIAGGLIFSPVAFAADEHASHGSQSKPTAENVIYQAGGGVLHDRMMEEVKRQQEFINKKGEGIHHVAYSVEDIDVALKQAEANGIRMIDKEPRTGIRGSRVAFAHPAATGSVLTEIVEPSKEAH